MHLYRIIHNVHSILDKFVEQVRSSYSSFAGSRKSKRKKKKGKNPHILNVPNTE